MIRVSICSKESASSMASLVNMLKNTLETANTGAIITFSGIAREQAHNGALLSRIDIESESVSAKEEIEAICEKAMKEYSLHGVVLQHKIGSFLPGETLLSIVVGAAHRKEAFDSIQDIITNLKKSAAIWKKEFTKKGNHWVKSEGDTYE